MTSDDHVSCRGTEVCLLAGQVFKWIDRSLYRCRVRMISVVEKVAGPGRMRHHLRPKKQRVHDVRLA